MVIEWAGLSQTPGQVLSCGCFLQPAGLTNVTTYLFQTYFNKVFLPFLNITAVSVAFEKLMYGLSIVIQNNLAIVKIWLHPRL